MINQIILVGRVVRAPELRESTEGKLVTTLRLAVQRPYKNPNSGEYDTDFIDCSLWQGVAEHANKYVQTGDAVSIKGRLIERSRKVDETKVFSTTEVVAERISIVCHSKNNEKAG